MDHSDRSDAELVQRAQNGEQRAFAMLLHRHGPAVRATVHADRDPAGATIATFVTAMRALHKQPSDAPVRPWLRTLAQKHTRRPDLEQAADPPPIDPDELDEIWAEVDLRWPNGRVPRSIPRWVGWAATLVVLVSLAVLIPYLALTVGGSDDGQSTVREELVARPYNEPVEREHAEELFDPGEDTSVTEPDMPELDVSDAGPGQPSPTPTDPAPAEDNTSPTPPQTSSDPQTPSDPQPPTTREPEAPTNDPPVDDDPPEAPKPPPPPDAEPGAEAPPVTEAPSAPEVEGPDGGSSDDDTPPDDPPEPGAGGGNMVAGAID